MTSSREIFDTIIVVDDNPGNTEFNSLFEALTELSKESVLSLLSNYLARPPTLLHLRLKIGLQALNCSIFPSLPKSLLSCYFYSPLTDPDESTLEAISAHLPALTWFCTHAVLKPLQQDHITQTMSLEQSHLRSHYFYRPN